MRRSRFPGDPPGRDPPTPPTARRGWGAYRASDAKKKDSSACLHRGREICFGRPSWGPSRRRSRFGVTRPGPPTPAQKARNEKRTALSAPARRFVSAAPLGPSRRRRRRSRFSGDPPGRDPPTPPPPHPPSDRCTAPGRITAPVLVSHSLVLCVPLRHHTHYRFIIVIIIIPPAPTTCFPCARPLSAAPRPRSAVLGRPPPPRPLGS